MPSSPPGHDRLLASLFALRRDEPARERALHELLARHAAPHVERLIVEEQRRGRLTDIDAQDLAHEVTLRLLHKLRRLLHEPRIEPIKNFAAYVGTVAHHALQDHLRMADPLRSRLGNRIRYVVTHTNSLALWGRDRPLCGLAVWEGRLDRVPVAPSAPLPAQAAGDVHALRGLVERTLRGSGGPVDLADLVASLASALNLPAEPFVPADSLALWSHQTDPTERLVGRQYLERLWEEIAQLPVRQRLALLLQLGLDDGESAPRVLAALGIATVRTLASTLELPLAQLLRLWNDLPLTDDRIAGMLGISRQQVINLRKSARERLARRMGRPRRTGGDSR